MSAGRFLSLRKQKAVYYVSVLKFNIKIVKEDEDVYVREHD